MVIDSSGRSLILVCKLPFLINKMASVTRQIFRLAVVAGTVPIIGVAVGYRMRSQQLAASSTNEKRFYKVRDIPLYPVSKKEEVIEEPYPRNALEANISNVRKSVVQFFDQYQESFETIKRKTVTSIEHSKATLEYIQTNPGELPRVIFIAVAGMGGVVLGYKGGAFKKLTYGTIAGLSCASLCYPKKSVELANQVSDHVQSLWKESGAESTLAQYWPSSDKQVQETPVKLVQKKLKFLATEVSQVHTSNEDALELSTRLEGDQGQSNPEDKDLYCTRSS
ncbi:hypothetical protein Btru_009575 [Bulinus truncatus]|nr:hypothetical protein Btru_009575 [Bulinus truncatus]